jgi:hypothetical protein
VDVVRLHEQKDGRRRVDEGLPRRSLKERALSSRRFGPYNLQTGESVKLTVIHEMDKPDSKLIEAVSSAWPHILSSLRRIARRNSPLARGALRKGNFPIGAANIGMAVPPALI